MVVIFIWLFYSEFVLFWCCSRAPVNGEISNSPLQNFCRDQVKFSRFICEIKNGDLFEGVVEDDFGSDAEKLPVILRVSYISKK